MHTFFGCGNFLLLGFFTGIILHGEGSFRVTNFFRGNFTLVNLPEFLYEIDPMSFFLFADLFYVWRC